MNLRIADIGCRLEGLSGPLAEEIGSRYSAFETVGESSVQLVVDAFADDTLEAGACDARDPVVFVERLGDAGSRYGINRIDNPFSAQVDLALGTASLRFAPNLYCVDSFLRVLFSLLLAREGGVLLHAASLKIGDRALIAVGRSGAGKTTLARQGFSCVLSDELVAVTRNGRPGSFVAHGTPFWGEFVAGRVQDRAEVEAVYVLWKGATDSVQAISQTQAAMELLGCTFFFGPAEHAADVLDFCVDLAQAKVAGALLFKPSPDVVGYLEDRMGHDV